MLIHCAVQIAVQDDIRTEVETYIRRLKEAWGYPTAGTVRLHEDLRTAWEDIDSHQDRDLNVSWEETQTQLDAVLQALTVATIMEWAGNSRDFEFQRLHGMGDGLYERLVRENGYHCRVYAPVGGHRDLLAYLVRRLLENGANSSFVHQLADERQIRRCRHSPAEQHAEVRPDVGDGVRAPAASLATSRRRPNSSGNQHVVPVSARTSQSM